MRNCWCSIDAHFYNWASSVWLVILPTKTANTSSLDGCDYAAGWLLNGYDNIWVTLLWRSPLSSPLRPTNSHCVLNNCTQNAYSLYWQPEYCVYVLSFESKIIETSQFLNHHYTHHLRDKWHSYIRVQRFQPGIHGITITALFWDIHSPTSSPFLIQLILFDFHDEP
jgi:hypothetical protein